MFTALTRAIYSTPIQESIGYYKRDDEWVYARSFIRDLKKEFGILEDESTNQDDVSGDQIGE